MRSKSMELMEQISNYIGDYYRQHHSTPTTREIATAVGISPASGYNYLVEMDKRGCCPMKTVRLQTFRRSPRHRRVLLSSFGWQYSLR